MSEVKKCDYHMFPTITGGEKYVLLSAYDQVCKERDELRSTYEMPPLGSAGQVIRYYQKQLDLALKALEFYANDTDNCLCTNADAKTAREAIKAIREGK